MRRSTSSFLPTSRLLFLLALAAPLFLFDATAALAVDALLLGAALVDALLSPSARHLRLERVVPERASLGSTLRVSTTIENLGQRSVSLRVTDDLPEGFVRSGSDIFRAKLRPGREETFAYDVEAPVRGESLFGDVHVRACGPLGLVWRQWQVPAAQRIRVIPGGLELRRHRLLGVQQRLAPAGLRSMRQFGERGIFESLREYARGDDPRTIDWKATAHRGKLMVRRYEAERSQSVLIAIDSGRLMTERVGGRERIDVALSAALLLADTARAHDDRVGVIVFDERVDQFLPPARGPLSRIADALGRVQPHMVEPDYPGAFTHIARGLRRRSLIVLFTDVVDVRVSAALVSQLARSARRHLPLFIALRNPDLDAAATAEAADEASVFRRAAAEELLQARANALAVMRRAGALVADVRPGEAIPVVVNRYLEVKRAGLL